MELVPVTLDEAKDFIRSYHRHNMPPVSWKFGVGLESGGVLIGVAMAGRPVARPLDLRWNFEITRVCTLGEPNANSMLYGAICRAAKALGYRVAYSYTLQSESGASLKASGFDIDEKLSARPTWDTPSRRRIQTNLFGEEQRPSEPKIRWKRTL